MVNQQNVPSDFNKKGQQTSFLVVWTFRGGGWGSTYERKIPSPNTYFQSYNLFSLNPDLCHINLHILLQPTLSQAKTERKETLSQAVSE